MHSVKSWLAYNDLSVELVREIVHGSSVLLLSETRLKKLISNEVYQDEVIACVDLGFSTVIDEIIAKVFMGILSNDDNCVKPLGFIEFDIDTNSIDKSFGEYNISPYALNRGKGAKPLVSMVWNGSAEDCIALAHEVAHAIQIRLSKHDQMPPVAREVCAFLGELMLIDWAQQNDPTLFQQLVLVWHDENAVYFGSDLEQVKEAIKNVNLPYDYRLNYPLARMVAAHIFENQSIDDIKKLFSSGKDAPALLSMKAIADLANAAENYLPPMPVHDKDYPALDAYRGLGAIALLDIDYWQGPSEQRIDDYYGNLLAHLQNGTAYVALRGDRKPIGYATWQKIADSNTPVLTRQSAPFGDHLQLQKALEGHLGVDYISSHHDRSSRQEQRAW